MKDLSDENKTGRKASRIELRNLRGDVYNLKTQFAPTPTPQNESNIELRRVTAYCTAESYDLKKLYMVFKENPKTENFQMYFGECLYVSIKVDTTKAVDAYFLHYGVTVLWGLNQGEEQYILKLISKAQENPYDLKDIEIEQFSYGISNISQIVNDKIYLAEDNEFIKMVLSQAMAQSVKLDYFDELVENTIDAVKSLSEEVEKLGKVSRKRQDIMKVMGKIHNLSLDLNLVSNILGVPAFVWEYSSFSSLYETSIRYLDIKNRATLFNKRCDIIHGILEILGDNITTQNSEKLEEKMAVLSVISAISGILQCFLLAFLIFLVRSSSNKPDI